MSTLVLALFLQAAADLPYSEVSTKFALADADRLMRDGKYLEAAVAYRNALLQPGDREAIRVPFALALFAHGDTAYAGVELRRAQTLYGDFTRLEIDAGDLFGTRGSLAKLADRAMKEKPDGDGAETQAALAYVWRLVGESDGATAALGRYVQSRGEDAFARALKGLLTPRDRKPPPAATPLPPAAAPPPTESARAGQPARAGVRFLENVSRPRGEIFEK
jgi:hypothetical protein